ncbi:MAG: sugar transferase [Planctomycetota bacterium]
MVKRLFDLSVAGAGLLAAAPVMLLLACWIKLDSRGPVLYRGRRAARGGGSFAMLKFRSMVTGADRVGGPTTAGDDPRVTRSGRFARRLKLDELPQLINVLRGEMSLVGPRPEVVDKVQRYSAEELRVMTLRPGITDWASIWNSDEGGVLAGAADADAAYEAVIRPWKIRLQQRYVDGCSLRTDLRILACTVLRVAGKRVSPPELADCPTFEELRRQVLALPEQTATRLAA